MVYASALLPAVIFDQYGNKISFAFTTDYIPQSLCTSVSHHIIRTKVNHHHCGKLSFSSIAVILVVGLVGLSVHVEGVSGHHACPIKLPDNRRRTLSIRRKIPILKCYQVAPYSCF